MATCNAFSSKKKNTHACYFLFPAEEEIKRRAKKSLNGNNTIRRKVPHFLTTKIYWAIYVSWCFVIKKTCEREKGNAFFWCSGGERNSASEAKEKKIIPCNSSHFEGRQIGTLKTSHYLSQHTANVYICEIAFSFRNICKVKHLQWAVGSWGQFRCLIELVYSLLLLLHKKTSLLPFDEFFAPQIGTQAHTQNWYTQLRSDKTFFFPTKVWFFPFWRAFFFQKPTGHMLHVWFLKTTVAERLNDLLIIKNCHITGQRKN